MEKLFPYYIVRFKLDEETYDEMIRMEFPYYIVRFKLFFFSSLKFEEYFVSILHSTI